MPKSNPLKSKIKQTFVLNMDIEMALYLIQKQFGASWQLESSHLDSDTIAVRASRKDAEVSLHLERWQGTESRLHLDGEVLLKTPYETWREWSGVICFVAMVTLWILLSSLPLTAIPFENLYFIMTSNSLRLPFMLLLPVIFIGIPFLTQRYFATLSPDIRSYAESQKQLANFVSVVKTLQSSQVLDTSRLEDKEADGLTESTASQQLSVDAKN